VSTHISGLIRGSALAALYQTVARGVVHANSGPFGQELWMRLGHTSLPEAIQREGCVGSRCSNDVAFDRIIEFGITLRFPLGAFSILGNI
jgi:hypothetical protein